MSGAFTPGPWVLTQKHTPADTYGHWSHEIEAGKGYSADGLWISAIIKPADARLICAAPDLLTALEALLPELDIEIETRQFGGNAEDWADIERLTNNARAAIARAKGGAA